MALVSLVRHNTTFSPRLEIFVVVSYKKSYVLGLFNEEDSYQKKEQIYEAKIILQSGEELNFGQGCYEPKLKQNSATWENAKHKVIQIIFRKKLWCKQNSHQLKPKMHFLSTLVA